MINANHKVLKIREAIEKDAMKLVEYGIRPALVKTKRDIVEMAYICGDDKTFKDTNGKPLSRQMIADKLFMAIGEKPFGHIPTIWQQICHRKTSEKSLFIRYRKDIFNE